MWRIFLRSEVWIFPTRAYGAGSSGEVVPCLGRGFADRLHRSAGEGVVRLSNCFSVISLRPVGKDCSTCFFQSGRLRYYRPVNHSSCISASTAEMSRSADASWGKIPTTRVRLRISRFNLSSPLMVRILFHQLLG